MVDLWSGDAERHRNVVMHPSSQSSSRDESPPRAFSEHPSRPSTAPTRTDPPGMWPQPVYGMRKYHLISGKLKELISSGTSFPFCTFTRYFTSYWRTSPSSNAWMVESCSRSEFTSTFDQCREEFTETYAGLTRTHSTYHCPYTSFESTQH
jgi:hypothetical protein